MPTPNKPQPAAVLAGQLKQSFLANVIAMKEESSDPPDIVLSETIMALARMPF